MYHQLRPSGLNKYNSWDHQKAHKNEQFDEASLIDASWVKDKKKNIQ